MRVTADHFFANRGGNLLERESASLGAHLGVHDDMEQQITELLAQVGIIRALDRVDDLVAFFNQ